jgi:hypothetical protein
MGGAWVVGGHACPKREEAGTGQGLAEAAAGRVAG